MEPGSGVPGWFVGIFFLVVIVGIGSTVWRVLMAQKIAKRSGMDPSLAGQITLMSDDGLRDAARSSPLDRHAAR